MHVICDPLKCLSPNVKVSGVHGSWVMREPGTWGKNCSLGENNAMIRNIIVQQIQQHISKSWTHFFVWFGRQFNPLCKSLNLCFEKGVLCAQILNHSEKNSWHLYIANLWEKIVVFRVPEVLLLPRDRCGTLCKCMSGETSGKAKLELSATRSAKLQLWWVTST